MVYTADSTAIRDAQKNVDDARLEIQKQSIQDQLDALDDETDRYNDLIDQINKAADTQTAALEKIRNKWQEVIDQQEYAKNLSLLTAEFGADAITKILTGNDDALLARWKEKYINILADIDMESQGYIGDMTQKMAGLYDVDLSSLQNQFQNVKESVDGVTNAVGNANTGAVPSNMDSGDKPSSGNLAGSIDGLGSAADESLPGVTSCMDDIGTSAMNAASAVSSVADAINNIPEKKDVAINVRTSGISGLSEKPKAFVGDADFTSRAFADGNKGLAHDEKNALRSEYGQPELTVYPDGKTELTTKPVMSDLPKGTVIYNEEQTKKIMNNKADAQVVKNYANGTVEYSDGTIVTAEGITYRPIQPGDRAWNLQKAFEPYVAKIREGGELMSNAYFEHQKQMEKWTKVITNNAAINNIVNNRNAQQSVNNTFNITMPNVTDSTKAEELMRDLQSLNTKKFQVDWNK